MITKHGTTLVEDNGKWSTNRGEKEIKKQHGTYRVICQGSVSQCDRKFGLLDSFFCFKLMAMTGTRMAICVWREMLDYVLTLTAMAIFEMNGFIYSPLLGNRMLVR